MKSFKLSRKNPQEGKAPRRHSAGTALGCLFLIILVVGVSGYLAHSGKSSQPKTPEELRTAVVVEAFNMWNGSHIALTQYLKDSMNDPDSYKHVETMYQDLGDTIKIKTTFRGRNAFGGVVTETAWATATVGGELLKVDISRGDE